MQTTMSFFVAQIPNMRKSAQRRNSRPLRRIRTVTDENARKKVTKFKFKLFLGPDTMNFEDMVNLVGNKQSFFEKVLTVDKD